MHPPPLAILLAAALAAAPALAERPALHRHLDAPLLFVRRHSYTGIHIYDTFYKWPPGGGGIYLVDNPGDPRPSWKIRTLVDESTPGSPGHGVYTHPELSFDATRLLFCHKPAPDASTSIYELHLASGSLRRLTRPEETADAYRGAQKGQHDTAPAYLPDGRIVFLSTRGNGLVPCNNTGVAILHVMNADGGEIHAISVNTVNEFDPTVLPDGRILYGRWEYVDKNALTIQSLWTIHPDGSHESALYANNMVFPEALLDARPVPGSHQIVATLAKHNGPPRGSIAFLDPFLGKNNPAGLTNLEHPADPTRDTGDSCEPWPLDADTVLFSGRPPGAARNQIEIIDRSGRRESVLADPDICLHSPMLVKPRPLPTALAEKTDRRATTGRLFVQNIHEGLPGVRPGEVKWLRVLEESSRTSGSTMGGSPFNQTFLVSAALAFSVKQFLGIVPVDEDGSVYFEAPSGRALYLQALDADHRLVQSMRTFIQAAPGVTRSCVGCHEHPADTPPFDARAAAVLAGPPRTLQPESWGGGHLDFPRDVQPVLDRHCVACHGGVRGFGGGLDLTGGWTEYFNIAYENLVSRRESQLTAHWIAGIDCMNGTAHWSSRIFAPRTHGSGAAPLADLLMEGHGGRIPGLTRRERDLLMAWMDTNGVYHGTWDQTAGGAAVAAWPAARDALVGVMREAGCVRCHGDDQGRVARFESDWINLQSPDASRILRAPMPAGSPGLGLGLCRDRPVDPARQRVRLLVDGYAHAVKPIDHFPRRVLDAPVSDGPPVVSFSGPDDPHRQRMAGIIRQARDEALRNPRVDMPGAVVIGGSCRSVSLAHPATPPPTR
jgi:mono/diheme cytochrome c family protein